MTGDPEQVTCAVCGHARAEHKSHPSGTWPCTHFGCPCWNFEPTATAEAGPLTEAIAAVDARVRRRGVQAVQFLDALRRTARAYPDTVSIQARVEFTAEAFGVIAPVFDALEALRDIIYASDGCHGHRGCAHSMEPWQRARRLLRALDERGIVDF
jgi:hypothetical protein